VLNTEIVLLEKINNEQKWIKIYRWKFNKNF
jgi:hypothetical protein